MNKRKPQPWETHCHLSWRICIWPTMRRCVSNRRKVSTLLSLLNSQYPSIKFTCQEEVDASLPFLDVKVTNGYTDTTIDGLTSIHLFKRKIKEVFTLSLISKEVTTKRAGLRFHPGRLKKISNIMANHDVQMVFLKV
jgi:hypothetical protein